MPGAKGARVFLHEIRPLLHIKSDTVFVPPTYFALHNDGGCCFFDRECGVDKAERSMREHHLTVHALLTLGARAGVIRQARRCIQIQCRDPLLAHQLLHFFNARFSFLIACRLRIAAHRLLGLQFSRRFGSATPTVKRSGSPQQADLTAGLQRSDMKCREHSDGCGGSLSTGRSGIHVRYDR